MRLCTEIGFTLVEACSLARKIT